MKRRVPWGRVDNGHLQGGETPGRRAGKELCKRVKARRWKAAGVESYQFNDTAYGRKKINHDD